MVHEKSFTRCFLWTLDMFEWGGWIDRWMELDVSKEPEQTVDSYFLNKGTGEKVYE